MPQPSTQHRSGQDRRQQGEQPSGGVLRSTTAVLLAGLADKAAGSRAQSRRRQHPQNGEQRPRGQRSRQGQQDPRRQGYGQQSQRGPQGQRRQQGQQHERLTEGELIFGQVITGQHRWGIGPQQRPPLDISEGHLLLVFEQFRTKLTEESPIGYFAIMHWTGEHQRDDARTAYYVERGANAAKIIKTQCQVTLSVLQDAKSALQDAKFANTEPGRLTHEAIYWNLMYLCQVHGINYVEGFGKIPTVETIAKNLARIADNLEIVDSSVRQAIMVRAPLADCYQQLHRFSQARQEMLTVFALLGRSRTFRDLAQIATDSDPELAEAVASGNSRQHHQQQQHRAPASSRS